MSMTTPKRDPDDCSGCLFSQSLVRLFWICVAACFSNGVAQGQGTLLYSNASSGSPSVIGLVLGNGQLVGMRFQLFSDTIIGGIGGNLQVSSTIGDGRIVGALVRLTSMYDYPDSTNLATPDILTTVTFSAGPAISDVAISINPVAVGPGYYGLVLGSGLSGASGEGSMSVNNPNYPDSSTFFYGAFSQEWREYGAGGGLRFAVYSAPIPEPSSLVLLLFAAPILCYRRRRVAT